MADVSKAEKLAAARRKLKEFQNQQRSKENQERNTASSQKNGEPLLNGSNSKPETKTFESKPHSEEKFELQKPDSISEQQPPLANYFSFAGKNNYFFDTLQKSASEESRESNGNEFYYVDKDKSSSSSVPEESNITHITTNNSSSISLNEEDSSLASSKFKVNDEEVQRLKNELENAITKIKMQANALDIITADREESERKLQSATFKLNSLEEIVQSLQGQLEESQRSKIHLNELVTELTYFREQVEGKDAAFQQQVNILKEQNDELQQNLEQQKEKHSNLQKKFEEVQSNRDTLSLRFQQMGIEMEGEGKSLASMNEEYELLKRKYAESQEQLKTLMFEKEHTDDNYRQYVENLKGELQQATVQVERLTTENQNLIAKLSSQTEHISSLEKHLQKPEKQVEHEKIISELQADILQLKSQLNEKTKQNEYLIMQLEEYVPLQEKICSLENELENARTNVTNAHELQSAVESNKVAASQAISQNSKLKEELVRLNLCVEELNKDKDALNNFLAEEKRKNAELAQQIDEKQNSSSYVDAKKSDAETNTEKNANSEQNPYGSANLDAMMQLQEKFKCVLNKMADLTDEKQQLEHLVLQLQCETETIEEYVALYQKQRSLLQQRARETDIKVDRMNREKDHLKSILRTILTVDDMNSQAVKKFIENSVPLETREELSLNDSEINGELYPLSRNDSGHHPSCPCCSGKLITI